MPELPCRHSSWQSVDQTAYHPRWIAFLFTLQSLAAMGRIGRAKVGQRIEARSDKTCPRRKENDEAHRSRTGGSRSLRNRARLLEGAPFCPPDGEADRGACATDSRHHPGRRPPDTRGSRTRDRRDARSRSSDAPPERVSAAPADPGPALLISLRGDVCAAMRNSLPASWSRSPTCARRATGSSRGKRVSTTTLVKPIDLENCGNCWKPGSLTLYRAARRNPGGLSRA